MATLDAKEVALVQKFRNRVTDIVPPDNLRNDFYLIRWLRARDLDLEKAEAMLRTSMSWFRRNEIDTIMEWKPLYNYFRFATPGVDKEGSPVMIFPIGLWDMREVVEKGDIIPGFRSVLRILTQLECEVKLASKRLDKPINSVILILDFHQFSYRQLNSRSVCQGAIELFRIFEANHPEILKSCFFINTPRIFPIFFAILKPFLSANTIGKMEFYGPQKSKWVRAILSKIPEGILPSGYGGTRPGNEFCTDDVTLWNDGPLPHDFYGRDMSQERNSIGDVSLSNGGNQRRKMSRRKSVLYEAHEVNLKREEIPAGSKLVLEFPVVKEKDPEGMQQLLKWRIRSEGYDIGFEVTFRDDFSRENTFEILIENHRIDSHLAQQEGSLLCDQEGTYIVTFDNSYSKRRKKIINYNVVLEKLESY